LLDEIIGAGTPTANLWRKRWMDFWQTGARSLQSCESGGAKAEQPGDESAYPFIRDLHRRQQAQHLIFQWAIEKDLAIRGPRAGRWNQVMNMLDKAGRYGASLISVTTEQTRNHTTSKVLRFLKLDLDAYEVLCAEKSVFGEMDKHTYQVVCKEEGTKTAGKETSAELTRSGAVEIFDLNEVYNLQALSARSVAGAAATGERRPEELSKLVQHILDKGTPVRVDGDEVGEKDEFSPFWLVPIMYLCKDGVGRAFQSPTGSAYITRESRTLGFSGLTVGEIDLVAAYYQLLLIRITEFLPDEELSSLFSQIGRYIKNSTRWRERIAQYFEILDSQAKEIIVRIPCGGAIIPDAEWEPRQDRAGDALPCLMQLRHEVRLAHSILAKKSTLYQSILALPRVQAAERKDVSALAIFLMDSETRTMKLVKSVTEEAGGKVLSVVYDGLYVLARNNDALISMFTTIAEKMYSDFGVMLSLKTADGQSLKKMCFD